MTPLPGWHPMVVHFPLALVLGAGAAQESRPSWIFIVLLMAATAALIMTGYRGGQNVYRYGVGVHGIPCSR